MWEGDHPPPFIYIPNTHPIHDHNAVHNTNPPKTTAAANAVCTGLAGPTVGAAPELVGVNPGQLSAVEDAAAAAAVTKADAWLMMLLALASSILTLHGCATFAASTMGPSCRSGRPNSWFPTPHEGLVAFLRTSTTATGSTHVSTSFTVVGVTTGSRMGPRCASGWWSPQARATRSL
ncbi:hypothetical protein VTJ49DRAFT_6076 [Mycothermus thermophilus]|uniref:Uncharacterized protein n=1 Tax=Humicola insolens TaxID=85995 RepID=A0ABR3VJM4_HUMIN